MANGKRIVLLCEDKAHEQFVTGCLAAFGARNLKHNLYPITASIRETGGNVLSVENVAKIETDAWKTRNRKIKTLLVIVADADAKFTRSERRDRLPREGASDLFVTIIPKRNIETWIKLGLDADPLSAAVSETANYKVREFTDPPSPKRAAKRLCDLLVTSFGKIPPRGVLADCFTDLTALRKGIRALDL